MGNQIWETLSDTGNSFCSWPCSFCDLCCMNISVWPHTFLNCWLDFIVDLRHYHYALVWCSWLLSEQLLSQYLLLFLGAMAMCPLVRKFFLPALLFYSTLGSQSLWYRPLWLLLDSLCQKLVLQKGQLCVFYQFDFFFFFKDIMKWISFPEREPIETQPIFLIVLCLCVIIW